MSIPAAASAPAQNGMNGNGRPPLGLLQYLEQEAELAESEVRSDAGAKALEISAAAVREADAHWRATVATREHAQSQARTTATVNAHRRSLHAILTARDEIVTRVLDEARTRCDTLSAHPGMAGLVREDLLRARDYLPDAPMVVQCVPALADMVREALKEIGAGEATVAVVPDAPFGLVVQSADGRIEVNLTLARRIASERSRLAIHILSLLKAPLP